MMLARQPSLGLEDGGRKRSSFVFIATDSWEVHIVNAGHLPALLVNREGAVEELGIDAVGLPLLIMDENEYQEFNTELPPGAAILMHTDGLNESMQIRSSMDCSGSRAPCRNMSVTHLKSFDR